MVSKTLIDDLASGKRNCMNLSFSGCGFLGIYHVGVASCFKEYAPQLYAQKITGASAGALAACALITGCCLGECTSYVIRVAMKARSRALGPLHPSFDVVGEVKEMLEAFLPKNAHEMASGRLFVSLTRVSDWKNVLVSQFDTREDLMQALICSSFVPFYSGLLPPKYKGARHIDGGITDNNPILDEDTITIAPFAGESDISPQDSSSNFAHISLAGTSIQFTTTNLYRISHALFPPEPEILSRMCQQGFDDALKFLQKNQLLSCGRHLNIISSITQPEPMEEYEDYCQDEDCRNYQKRNSFVVNEDDGLNDEGLDFDDEDEEYDEEDYCEEDVCVECKHKQSTALEDSLPTAVIEALNKASDSDKGLLNTVYNMRLVKFASIMAVPCILPLDIALVTATKLYQWAPYMPRDIHWLVQQLSSIIQTLMDIIQTSRHKYSARLTCQLAITEMMNQTISPTRRRSHLSGTQTNKKRQMSMGFSVDFHSHYPSPLECVKDLRSHLLHEPNDCAIMEEAKPPRHPIQNSSPRRTPTDFRSRSRSSSINNLNGQPTPCDMSYDTFENCLHVAEEMDAVLAFHYLDEKNPNTYKVTEIFALEEERNQRWREFSSGNSSDMSWDHYLPKNKDAHFRSRNTSADVHYPRDMAATLEMSYSELNSS